jgi:hypothetical protein
LLVSGVPYDAGIAEGLRETARVGDREVRVDRGERVVGEQRAARCARSGIARARQERGEIVAAHLGLERAAVGLAHAGEAEDRRRQVEHRRDRRDRARTAHVGVCDHERDVEVLAVDEAALLARAVCAAELAVVGGVDDDRAIELARGRERVEHRAHVRVDVALTVHVVLEVGAPEIVARGRDLAEGVRVDALELRVRSGAAREALHERRGQRDRVAIGIDTRARHGQQRHAGLRALRAAVEPERAVGVDEHDVVRVHEVDREEPRSIEGGRALAEPACGRGGRVAVVAEAALGDAVDVAAVVVVGEAVGLERVGRRRDATARVVDLREVPLALVRRVVARGAEGVAERRGAR